MPPPPAPDRRRACQRLLGAALLSPLLPALLACAGGASGGWLLPVARLDELLARRFPVTRSLAGLADLTLHSPRLSLLPAANRVATALDLVLTERLGGRRYTGAIELDSALQLDLQQGAVRLSAVRVQRLGLDQLPPAAQTLLARHAPPVVEQLLEGLVIYRLPPERLATLRAAGRGAPPQLRVQPDGLRLELAP
ncbi:MAG: hypothetical protein IT498_05110 [Rubrivivax sp.]|uniref:hypothetical protein n=1 Tax=Ottowia sp. TaxID=1898956 RepID=UPI00217B7E88|nr:hypothetical protein [Ottowia sp.]MCC6813406.1 hypothetical protein [Rubrivivax sp.]HNR84458.1 hypothetical protein [Ottowia sp.]HQQ52852.1 hypothetical protein [Ottowia sp.]